MHWQAPIIAPAISISRKKRALDTTCSLGGTETDLDDTSPQIATLRTQRMSTASRHTFSRVLVANWWGVAKHGFFLKRSEDLVSQSFFSKIYQRVILEGSHRKRGRSDVLPCVRVHCAVFFKFREKWSRLDLILHLAVQILWCTI